MYKNEILLKNYLIEKIDLIQEREKIANQIDNFLFEASLINRDENNLIKINEVKAIKSFGDFIKKKFSSTEEMIKQCHKFTLTRKFRVSNAVINYLSLAFQIYNWYVKGELSDIRVFFIGAQSVLALIQTVLLILEKMQNSEDKETKNKLKELDRMISSKTNLNNANDLSKKLLEFEEIGSKSRDN